MRKRDTIQCTHERLLDVISTAEAEEVMADHYDTLKLRRDPSDSPIKEFEKSRKVIQPIQGALGELAWRRVAQEMSDYYTQTGSLEREGAVDSEKYNEYSPALHRFMATMHVWLGPALQEVLDDAHAGRMPHAAIYGVMVPARERRREAAEWQKRRALAKGEPWTDAPRDAGELFRAAWGETNLPIVAAGVLGRAMAVSRERDLNSRELTSRLQDDINLGADLSSVVNKITVPMQATIGRLFEHYSLWEQGKLSSEELLEYCRTNPFYTSAEAHPTLENGPWKNPGVCASDLRIGRPERFPVVPNHFLQQLGVFDSGEITLTKLYVASANVIARDTVLWHVQDL